MELTSAAALRRSLASMYLVVPRERRRRRPAMVSCVGRECGRFANKAHIRYYEAAPRTLEAAARDLAELRAMGLVTCDAGKQKILSPQTNPRYRGKIQSPKLQTATIHGFDLHVPKATEVSISRPTANYMRGTLNLKLHLLDGHGMECSSILPFFFRNISTFLEELSMQIWQ